MTSAPAPAPADGSVLSVRGLVTHFYGREGVVAAVRNTSLEVGRGEKVAIVGESGCGKSALALSILGTHRAARPHGRWRGLAQRPRSFIAW